MPIASELAELFRRDLTRLMQEVDAYPDDASLWTAMPGVTNSAGNLALHIEGNLREFVGRQLGGVAYTRQRDLEFAATGMPKAEILQRMSEVRGLVVRVVSGLDLAQLNAAHPQLLQDTALSTRQFLIHLLGHLNFHLGQVDYLRRILTQGASVAFARLEIGPR